MTPLDADIAAPAPAPRRSRQARVRWGDRVVTIGGDAPVRVQSMTNTDTVDAIGTAIQVKELAAAGSELVRITVNTPEAAQASSGGTITGCAGISQRPGCALTASSAGLPRSSV